jgi:hypothetical protein
MVGFVAGASLGALRSVARRYDEDAATALGRDILNTPAAGDD